MELMPKKLKGPTPSLKMRKGKSKAIEIDPTQIAAEALALSEESKVIFSSFSLNLNPITPLHFSE